MQTSAPAGLSSSLQPWWLNQPSPGHLPGTLRALPNRSCQGCAPCAARATLHPPQSHAQPVGSALQGAAHTHPSTAGTLPVPCGDLGRRWAQTLEQKASRSFCIVWLSGDCVSPGEMPYRAPAASIPAGCSRDSHSLPVWDLFGLGLVQILAG